MENSQSKSKSDTTKIITKKDSTIVTGVKTVKYTTIQTIKYDHRKDWDFCNCPLIINLIWPVFVLVILLVFRKPIKELIDILRFRLSKGEPFDFGPVKFHGITNSPDMATKSEERERKIEQILSFKTGDETITKEFPLNDLTAKNILSTFWKGQKTHFPDFNSRFTFLITPNKQIDEAMRRLQWIGLVAFETQAIKQYFLTDIGIKFCQKNEKYLEDFSYFDK